MIRFCEARTRSTFSVCASAGAPRRIASLRFSGLPASAVPNSLISSWSRRLNGSRRVLLTRSVWTVCSTRSAGTSGSSGSPLDSTSGPSGSQSMKYSAISDCGSLEQVVSSPSTASGPLSSTVTTARLLELTSRSVTEPAFTPATRTSEPSTRPKALYISIR